jgi:hypothetical protein
MTDKKRPYGDLSARDLERELAMQLNSPVEGGPVEMIETTAFGDTQRTWLMGNPSHAITSNARTISGEFVTTDNTVSVPATGQQWKLNQTYLYKKDGTVKAIGKTKVRDMIHHPETDLEWLRRRIDEVLWVPL